MSHNACPVLEKRPLNVCSSSSSRLVVVVVVVPVAQATVSKHCRKYRALNLAVVNHPVADTDVTMPLYVYCTP